MIKKVYLLCVFALCFSLSSMAQSPQSFTYQAVARDANGNPLASKSLGVRLSIINLGASVYTETFTVNTNAYGMFSVILGTGAKVSGDFFTIKWTDGSSSPKQLKVEIDPAGGSAYTDMGTTGFNSVPYALVADKAINTKLSDLTDVNDLTPTTGQVLQYNGSAWVAGNAGGSVQTNSTLSGDGSSANPLKLSDQSAINGQVLQWNGTSWLPATISGGVGDNWGTQFAKTNVTLSGNGTTASPLTIAQQGAATGESLIWNGTLWSPSSPGITTDGVFTGKGTPALPLKLGQQSAVAGDVLKWNGTTWIPGTPFTLPYFGNGVGAAGFATFSISNNATSGPSRNAIEGNSNGGTGVSGIADPAGGKGVSGKSDNGIGVYGASLNGSAAIFDGSVGVFGALKVFGSTVTKTSDYSFYDQSSNLNLTTTTSTALPGLDAMSFTIPTGVSAALPGIVKVTFNCPSVSTTSNASAGEGYQFQIFIKQGATVIKQINCNDFVPSLGIRTFSYTAHCSLTTSGSYTASVEVFKGNATPSANISVSSSQVQIQVINP